MTCRRARTALYVLFGLALPALASTQDLTAPLVSSAVPASSLDGIEVGPGLRAEYFDSRATEGLVVRRVDAQVDFDWQREAPVAGVPADHFAVRWRGFLVAPLTGKISLLVTSDGGTRLWLGEEWIYEDWPKWDLGTRTVVFEAEAGAAYALTLEYHDHAGDASVRLGWQYEGQPETVVPEAALRHAARAPAGPLEIPKSSTVSPVCVTGTLPPGGRDALTVDEEAVPFVALGRDEVYVDVPLAADGPRTVRLTATSEPVSVTWEPTDVLGRSEHVLRAGDALLLAAECATKLTLRRGDVETTAELAAGQRRPFAFIAPGWHEIVARSEHGGEGKITVLVVAARFARRLVGQVHASFDVFAEVEPKGAAVTITSGGLTTVGKARTDGDRQVARFAALQRGTTTAMLRLGGPRGPVIAAEAVETFTLEVPGLGSAPVNADTRRGVTTIRLRPFVSGVHARLSISNSGARFQDGTRTMSATTTGPGSTFRRTVSPVNGEEVGELEVEYRVPEGERTFCWETALFATSPGLGEEFEIPTCLPPWNDGNTCRVIAYRSLIFTLADDELEDEVQPEHLDLDAAVVRCKVTPLRPADNFERWLARDWFLVTGERPEVTAVEVPPDYRLGVSDPEPGPRVDDPIPALFGGVAKESDCEPCDGACEDVTPAMNSGSVPSLYVTSVMSCDEDDEKGRDDGAPVEREEVESPDVGGAFIVCKLDAHGTANGTTDKFPDHAEVLPRRGGYVNAPVIQIDWGGDGAIDGCSLYGTICATLSGEPSSNVWQLTAVAKDPSTEEDIPAGHVIAWSGLPPYRVVETKNGQDRTIEVTFPPGRHFPVLEVFGPDPLTQGQGLVGRAEIHSIVVEERPTCNVEPRNADVPPDVRKGTPFHVTSHVGSQKVPVDIRLGIRGSGHPHPDFDVRGRVSLDGYPQNEYWVTSRDSGDLPQVVRQDPDDPVVYYLQGYGVASIAKDDLRLVIDGQAQLERCASPWFYFDCTPCSASPPPRFPVDVGWMQTDSEPFNSSFPVLFLVDEPELKYDEDRPGVISVSADNVADDYEGTGTARGYDIDRGHKGRVNFIAEVAWDPLEIDGGYMKEVPAEQALRITWHYAALDNQRGGPNFNRTPGLRDLHDRMMMSDPSGKIAAILVGLQSRVQLDFTKERDDERIAKAYDRFCVAPHSLFSHSDLGRGFWDPHEVVIDAGDKVFHIVIPNRPDPGQRAAIAAFDPRSIFDYSSRQFAQSIYRDWRWEAPVGSGQESELIVYSFDLYRNVLPEGREVSFTLEGGGRLGAWNPRRQARPQNRHPAELVTQVLADGSARIRYEMERYPSCPWQFQGDHTPAVIYLIADGASHVANYSAVTTSEALPSALPPLVLQAWYRTTGSPDPNDPATNLLDIDRRDAAEVTAWLTRGGVPLEDVPIKFTSTNGALAGGRQDVVRTDAAGEAKIRLTARDARLDHDGWGSILVTAAVSDVRASIGSFPVTPSSSGSIARNSLLRWIDSSPTTMSVLGNVVCPDTGGATSTAVETIDGFINAPSTDRTTVVITGPPNHPMRLDVSHVVSGATGAGGPAGLRVEYPFDVITNGESPSLGGADPASVTGGASTDSERRQGSRSLALDGSSLALVPDQPAVEALGGVEITCWIRPADSAPSTIFERPGQYRLERLADMRLRLTTLIGSRVTSETTSAVGVGVDQWAHVDVRLAAGLAKLGVGGGPAQLDSTFAPNPPGAFVRSSDGVRVGERFSGLIDHLTFTKGGFDATGFDAIGVSGSIGPNGTFTTDANGRFVFTFVVQAATPTDYRPVTYVLRAYGSREVSARIHSVPRTIWGDLYAVGAAFLRGEEGLGGDASAEERIAAWASDMIPFLSDLRTLGFEIYKAATGCDDVSWLNVTFATVGLVADIATFGTAGAAIRASKHVLKNVFRLALKEVAQNGAMDLAFRGALEGIIRVATVEVMNTDGTSQRLPKPWVQDTQAFLTEVRTLMAGTAKDVLNDAFRSMDDLFVGLKVYGDYPATTFSSLFETAASVQRDLSLACAGPPRAPPLLVAYRPAEEPPGDVESPAHGPWIERKAAPARLPLKTAKSSSQRVKETMAILAEGINGVDPRDVRAVRGLERITLMVVQGARSAEDARKLARRVKRGLMILDPGSRGKFLRDFDDLYRLANRQGDELLGKVGDMARDFAARGKTRADRRKRTKGAAYAIQEARKGLQSGRLRGADSIEPHSPRVRDNRLWRDLFETDPITGIRRYVELKAWRNVNKYWAQVKLAAQMTSHFARLPRTSLIHMTPIVIRYAGQAMTTETKKKIIGGVVRGLVGRHGFSPQAAKKWAFENITFERVRLDYALR